MAFGISIVTLFTKFHVISLTKTNCYDFLKYFIEIQGPPFVTRLPLPLISIFRFYYNFSNCS